MTNIEQLLPKDVFDALLGANSPSASNVFATIADTGLPSVLAVDNTTGANPILVSAGQYIQFGIVGYNISDSGGFFNIQAGGTTQSMRVTATDTLLVEAVNSVTLSHGATATIALSAVEMRVLDNNNNKGLVYAADYSTAGILDDRWIPDYGAVKALVAGTNTWAEVLSSEVGAEQSGGTSPVLSYPAAGSQDQLIFQNNASDPFTPQITHEIWTTSYIGITGGVLGGQLRLRGSNEVTVGIASSEWLMTAGSIRANTNVWIPEANDIVFVGATYNNSISATAATSSSKTHTLQDRTGTVSHTDQIGGNNVNALITSPAAGQDGYHIAWDNGAQEYTLVAVSAGVANWEEALTAQNTTGANDAVWSKTGTASSTATQVGSQSALFQASLWDGGAESIESMGIKAVASTTVDRDFFLDFDANGGFLMRLTKDAQLSINTTPATNTMLTVDGTTSGAANYIARFRDVANANVMLVRDDGRVGIGANATAPEFPLDVRVDQNAATLAQIRNQSNGTAAQAALRVRGGQSRYMQIQIASSINTAVPQFAGNLAFYSNSGIGETIFAHDGVSGNFSWRIGTSVTTLVSRARMRLKSVQGDYFGLGLGNNQSPSALLHLGGANIGIANQGTNGLFFRVDGKQVVDTSTAASGTATNSVYASIGAPILGATNTSVTTTYASTVRIAGAPSAGLNMTITNAYSLLIDGGDVRMDANLLLNTDAPHASMTNGLAMGNGTAPSANITDGFAMYSADVVAGNAAAHFRTENGQIVKLYSETTGVAEAAFVENAGGTAVNVDSTFGGYTVQQIAQALQNIGLLT